jgi:hypothetical protein
MTRISQVSDQLGVLAELHQLLQSEAIAYWLFGGWAVDFHVGRVTRVHGDLDVAVWWHDRERVAALLEVHAWAHKPEVGEDGYTCYERGSVRLEVAFLARDDRGHVYTPLRDGQAQWPNEPFGDDVMELWSVRARVIRLAALIADKSVARENSSTGAKDRADLLSLGGDM